MDILYSKYDLLCICVSEYAKLKLLWELFPAHDHTLKNGYLGFLVTYLHDTIELIWLYQKQVFEIEDKLKTTSDAKMMEQLFKSKTENENIIKKLCKIPENYPYTIEQSLYFFDFFEEFYIKIKQ